jgi:hypothetical protein
MTLARSSGAATRIASLARSPTSASVSVEARMYVPIPPNQRRSVSAFRIALMS